MAATLRELKASRLLPASMPDDEEDPALLEGRDLLFARLLQYRAFKEVGAWSAGRMTVEGRAWPRQAGPEPRFAALMPELVLGLGPEQFARIAALVMDPPVCADRRRRPPARPRVSVREQAGIVAARVRERGEMSLAEVIVDADGVAVIVARFLALLGLFRGCVVVLAQTDPFEQLWLLWDRAVVGWRAWPWLPTASRCPGPESAPSGGLVWMGVVRTLLACGLIEEAGVDAEHGAALYGTTPYFLERLGLDSLENLPPLAPHLPEPLGELSPQGSRRWFGAQDAKSGEPFPFDDADST